MGSISSLNSLLSRSSTSSSSIDLSSLLQAATGATSSGIDVNAAVQAAVYAAQAPERQWQGQQSTVSSQISALTSVQSTLTNLAADLSDLNDLRGSLAGRSVGSSTPQVSATASPGAPTGQHSVTVQSLATAASWYSPALSGAADAGTSTLTIARSDGTTYTFGAGSGTNSLAALAQSINGSSAGINASVVSDATGSRLALVSATTGTAADFSVSYGTTASATWSSATVPASSPMLGAGTFDVGDGTSTSAITVNSGDTLATVADRINTQGLAISASVVIGSDGAHLELSALSGATVLVSSDPAFSLTRAGMGANASLTVDGVPVSSATNTVTGALPDVTLQLTGTTPAGSPAALSVGADSSSIQHALSKFVSDYNAALSGVSAQFSYSASTNSQGPLGADSGIRSLQNMLLSAVGYTAAGSSGGTVQSLADLGVSMGDDGSLTLDSSKLNTALANPASIQTFFQGTSFNGFAQQFQSQVALFNSSSTGSITRQIQQLNQQYSALGGQVTDYENGYIATQRTLLTAMYSKAEIALQQLPAQMKQIQAELGNNSSGG